MDLGPGERFFWFTTTGWMMWNFLIGGLLVGATIVLFDGSPGHPDLGTLWALAEAARHHLLRGVRAVRAVVPQGGAAPARALRPRLAARDRLHRCAAVGRGLPLDRRRGRQARSRSARCRAARTCARRSSGRRRRCRCGSARSPARSSAPPSSPTTSRASEIVDEVGELVITEPMPSMPVSFWNDPDGSRLREAYFEDFPGVWRHGDWVRVTPRGSYVIYGRSDSTLNRGGVRMGTADFYAVVEGFDEVADSLVIDTTELDARRTRASCCASSFWSRVRRWRTSSRRCARRCAPSCRPATSPTGSSSSTPCRAPSTARSARCR